MLTRKQFRQIQRVRGLSAAEIINRTGIPPQSLMALMEGSDKDAKDPQKMISTGTFQRLVDLLGIQAEFEGLRCRSVIEWPFDNRTRKGELSWKSSFSALAAELLSDDIELAEVRKANKGWFDRTTSLIYIRDVQNDVRIVVSNVTKAARQFIESALALKIDRIEEQQKIDFIITGKLIQNDVYRTRQFDIVVEGRHVRYTWGDVQAAAKEFNFEPEMLIDMMLEKKKKGLSDRPVTHDQNARLLRVASG